MSPLWIVLGVVAGAAVGAGIGWLCVWLERIEKLEQEDAEDWAAYEKEVAEQRAKAEAAGETPPEAEPWNPPHYGWTWLERWAAPLLGALAFGLFTAKQGWMGGQLLIHLLWCAVLVQIVVFDFKHRLILNRVTYPSILVGLALSPISPGMTIVSALMGAAILGAFFFMLNVLARGGMGLGDVKLAAVIGAITGIGTDPSHFGGIYAVVWGMILAGVVSVLLLVTRIRGLKDFIAYGPYLCVGAALILYQGP